MIEFLLVKDSVTGEELQIVRQSPASNYVVLQSGQILEEVRKGSIRKVIRAWMRYQDDNSR